MPLQTRRWKPALIVALLAVIVVFGVMVRWQEPASSSVIPAEDPYTHMALVRGHLADGDLDPLVDGGTLYPPGMHAVLAAAHAFTGADLADIFRFGPVLFGAVAIIGTAVLLWRHAGPTAAVVGALGMALAPEVVFRTTMMAPTAVDLALMPFLLLAVLETLRGRLAWSIPLALGFLFLMLAHPWVMLILAPATLGTIILASILGRSERAERTLIRPAGASLVLGITGIGLLVSMTSCAENCGLGFQSIGTGASRLDMVALLVGGVCLAAAAAYAAAARTGKTLRPPSVPLAVRGVFALTGLLALVVLTAPAMSQGMPEHVDLPRMFGLPLLLLAGTGLVAAPFLRWPAGWAGVALCVVTYPFVIYNPLQSPFWPHRTAAYLGVGLVVLAGLGAAAIVLGARWAAARLSDRSTVRASAGSVLVVLAVLIPVGSVYAATPPAYETGWYRLYQECEFDAIRDLAADLDPDTVVITGDWRTKLVAAAFATDPDNVWFSESFFMDQGYRERTALGLSADGRELIVLEDRHLITEHPEYDVTFLQGDDWRLESSHCSEGLSQARLSVYSSEVTA